jgi:hypothetical protein
MPRKPTIGRRAAGGQHVAGLRARGMKAYGTVEHIEYAIDFEREDRESGTQSTLRYNRTYKAIMKRFRCSESAAKRAIAAARAWRMDLMADRLPTITADLIDQLHEVADRAMFRGKPGDYGAAVAALREIGKIAGVYAPIKVEVEHTGHIEVALEIDATLSVLNEEDHAALRKIAEKIETARIAGLLPALVEDDEEIEDAVVIESGPGEN